MKTLLNQVSLLTSVTIVNFAAILLLCCIFANTSVAQSSNNNDTKNTVKTNTAKVNTQEAEITKPETVIPLSEEPASLFAPDHPGNKTQKEAKKQAEKNGTKFLNVEPERKKGKQ